jgi:hypothetical protein
LTVILDPTAASPTAPRSLATPLTTQLHQARHLIDVALSQLLDEGLADSAVN